MKLRSGKLMPVSGLDAETYYLHPDRAFTYSSRPRLVIVTDEGDVIRGRRGAQLDSGVLKVEGRESHFARCPGADEHRRSG